MANYLCMPIAFFLAVASPLNAASEGSEPVRIGTISVLSGEGASWGINHQRASLLAAEDFNSQGGMGRPKIEILSEDSPNGIARNAVSAYFKLVHGNGIKFVLGPVMMDELLAVAPLAKRDGVFLGGATYMPGAPENFFTTWIDADVESDLTAEYVYRKHKRAAVLASQQSWESQIAHRFKTAFERLGGAVVSFEEPSFEAAEVKTEVLRMKSRRPDAVFISSYLLLAKYAKEMRTIEVGLPLFGIELDQSVIDAAGGTVEGLVFIAPSAPSESFVKSFRKRWGDSPDIPAASAYDAARLLFAAIEKYGENVPGVISYFRDFTGYDGVSGRISRRGGKTLVSTSHYAVRDGKIARLD